MTHTLVSLRRVHLSDAPMEFLVVFLINNWTCHKVSDRTACRAKLIGD